MGFLVLRAGEPSEAITGLLFANNGTGTPSRFFFSGATLPPAMPATLLFKVLPNDNVGGYRTTFFYCAAGSGAFTGSGYHGAHPYPTDEPEHSSTNLKWEISIAGGDIVDDVNANDTTVVFDTWHDQAFQIQEIASSEVQADFYWNLGVSSNRLIQYISTSNDWAASYTGERQLAFGAAPWSMDGESGNGVFRGFQIYTEILTIGHVQALRALDTDAQVLSYCSSNSITSLHYSCMNPTPDDITDKSGNGNDPEWFDSNRPALWEQ